MANRLLTNSEAMAMLAEQRANKEPLQNKLIARQQFNELMTHQPQAQGFMPQPVGDYLSKVYRGGYLQENIGKFDQAFKNARLEMDGQQPKTEDNLLDYFGFGAMTAYHGSPHKFAKFSMDNIGTGEGAQAYGHGLYFAEGKNTAHWYMDKLSGGSDVKYKGNIVLQGRARDGNTLLINEVANIKRDPLVMDAIKGGDVSFDDVLALQLDDMAKSGQYDKAMIQSAKDSINKINIDDVSNVSRGNMYEVDIPDEHVKNFLDWDAPLSEQPEGIQNIASDAFARETGITPDHANYNDMVKLIKSQLRDKTGKDFHNSIVNRLSMEGSESLESAQSATSKYLDMQGIKGIKYFDGSSRAGQKGTRNLVVFDDGIVKTLSRNGEDIKGLIE